MEEPKQIDLRSLWFLDLLALLEPVEQFTNEVKRIAALESLDFTERMTMIREARSALLREMASRFETFTTQLEERKNELQDIVNPPKPDLIEQMRHLLMEMSAVVQKVALREELTKRWEAQSPEEVLRSYEDSLEAQDNVTVEMFEAYAEDILERKGNKAAVAAFRERAEEAIDSRLTSEQLRAKQELKELERVGSSLHTIFVEIASSIKKLLI
ncbi:MAG: hypothetical protein ACE10C_13500 [Candidatus Binatia bacterium]